MERKNLYDMPREMLIKIIENMNEVADKEFEDRKRVLIRQCQDADYTYCLYCPEFRVISIKGFAYYSNGNTIVQCACCGDNFCNCHINKIRKNITVTCSDCNEKYFCTDYLCNMCEIDSSCPDCD